MADFPNNEDLNTEDPLEKLLDQESDEEFGLPEFKEHFADELTPAVLKDWTAKDFASIYVRFRPFLERHARRFLVNPSQVDEVVQDAFLYLMTTLPELDSEVGVLKFLKWKTRLLCLDVIRTNSRASFAPFDEQPEMAADMPEMSSDLERAEDAAIVSLALAKLQPRHREALVATIYEEKSTEVVAAQMGLSENAFRQLLFRARASFKKVLIGEAETAGLSLSQILTVAARKAAAESGKYIGAAGAFLLVLAIALGVVPNLGQGATTEVAVPLPQVTSPSSNENTQGEVATGGASEESQLSNAQGLDAQETAETIAENSDSTANSAQTGNLVAQTASVIKPSVEAAKADPTQSERVVLEQFFQEALDESAIKVLSRSTVGTVVGPTTGSKGTLTITNDSGLTANLAYDLATENGIQYTWFSIELDGNDFVAVPKVSLAEKVVYPSGEVKLRYVATDLLIGDTSGNYDFIALDNTAVSLGAMRLEVNIDSLGQVTSSSLYLTKKP